ncbi:MAG: pilus assembly protein N-terminal domain-containing protein [Phycisphaerales bacterium]|nr:pilus assembly protein N-terminal domain-containing protein [Phycisphaerales bacterium]
MRFHRNPNTLTAIRNGIAILTLGGIAAVSAIAQSQPRSAAPAASTTPAAAPIPPEGVQIKISDVSAADRVIRVPANKAILVDFNVPLREVRITKPEVAEVNAISPKQILVTGKSFGVTQLITWVNENEQRVFDVAVDLELDRLAASIRLAAPRAQVKAYSVMDSVVLTGSVPDADAAKRIMDIAAIYSKSIVNQMRVGGTQQVLLRCTVAEVNKRAVRQMGFNGWVAGDNVRDAFFANNLDQINPANIGAAADSPVNLRIPFLTGEDGIPVTPNPTMLFGFPRVQMQIFVQALRENGLLRVLAEPNLVAVNGQQATFLAGGEFPIPVPQGGNNNGITIEYREFGVRLRFTPAIIGENVIRLNVEPEVSEPDFANAVTVQGFTVPGLVQRRVQTVVELGNGQTFAIGGLLSERVRAVSALRGAPLQRRDPRSAGRGAQYRRHSIDDG